MNADQYPPPQTIVIRPARPEEAALLTELTLRSKAYWGYDADFMAVFAAEAVITQEDIHKHIFYVAEENGKVGGYYALEKYDGDAIWLDSLFIDPAVIRGGYGSQLWDHAVETARSLGYRFMDFESDPNAEGFYLRKGAVRIGTTPRPINGQPDRVLPKMRYALGSTAAVYRSRPYRDVADRDRMLELVYQFPDEHLNVVDLPYRLSSWALEVPKNVRLWEDESGALAAWALVKTPWWSLDYALRPDAHVLETEIVRWAVDRCQIIAAGKGENFPVFVRVRSDRSSLMAILKHAGFERNDWSLVHMSRPLTTPVAPSQFPAGFTVRPLRGLSEVEDYVALHRAAFGSNAMTVEWRARTLDMPGYAPDLDLFVVAPDGKPVAFCIGWRHGQDAQVEPIGVHPDYQKLGLGRALLLDVLGRMKASSAEQVHIESYTDNDPARGLYESVGFEVKHTMLSFSREFKSRQAVSS